MEGYITNGSAPEERFRDNKEFFFSARINGRVEKSSTTYVEPQ
jgi:hypothetical protein